MRFSCRILSFALCFFAITPQAAQAEKLHCPAVTDNDEKNTETARKYFKMGAMFLENSDYVPAAESFECVLKFVPYSLSARYQLAKAYDGMGYYSKARRQYELILAYDSPEAENVKAEIRNRLEEIKGLADKPALATAPAADAPEDDSCPAVVQGNLTEAMNRAANLLKAQNWEQTRAIIEETLGKLAGATPRQRQLCLASPAGLNLLLYAGVASFNLGAADAARKHFLAALAIDPDATLPDLDIDSQLKAFYLETRNAYMEHVKAEITQKTRIQAFEQIYGLAPEPADNPGAPVEHAPPVKSASGNLVFVCRVQDLINAAAVRLVYRADGKPAQELSPKKIKNHLLHPLHIQSLSCSSWSSQNHKHPVASTPGLWNILCGVAP